MIAVYNHDPIGAWQNGRYGLETPTGSHGVGNHAVGAEALDRAPGMAVHEVVNLLPLSQAFFGACPLLNGLVGAGRSDLVGGSAVKPVVRAAQARTLRRNDSNMVRGEGLAQCA